MTKAPFNRILMVEDDLDIQAVARLALEAVGGFTVGTCDNGHEAVVAAPTFAPDLVLLDVMMPGMDGPTTLQALRRLPGFEEIPVVFMTAKAQQHEVAQYQQYGAWDVIPKPFDPMTLASQLHAIWNENA